MPNQTAKTNQIAQQMVVFLFHDTKAVRVISDSSLKQWANVAANRNINCHITLVTLTNVL